MERLQKVIAAAGITSRRKAEVLISEGRVAVNGETITELGYKVKRGDLIEVDGKAIEKEDKVYFLMNKPKRTMCTSDDEFGRQTVVDLVDCRQRIFTVGRLDYDTSGVIILTNDGDFANEIIHPRYHIPKVYNLTINGILTPEDMKKIKAGIVLDDGIKTLPAKYRMTEKDTEKNQCSFDLTIVEGRNRQIRRMCAQAGLTVKALRRVREGSLQLGGLKLGTWRFLTQEEVELLRQM